MTARLAPSQLAFARDLADAGHEVTITLPNGVVIEIRPKVADQAQSTRSLDTVDFRK